MPYLVTLTWDAQSAGDCRPTIRAQHREEMRKIQNATVEQLIAMKRGSLYDEIPPFVTDPREHNEWRVDELTPAQAAVVAKYQPDPDPWYQFD